MGWVFNGGFAVRICGSAAKIITTVKRTIPTANLAFSDASPVFNSIAGVYQP